MVSAMKHTKRKKRLLRNIVQRPESEVMERLFGKRVKRELDKLVEESKCVANIGARSGWRLDRNAGRRTRSA